MFDLHKPTPKPTLPPVMREEINIDSDPEGWYRLLVDEAVNQVANGEGPIIRPLSLTPAFAEVLVQHNGHNRKPSPSVVDKYARAMKDGKWELTMECITVDRDGFIQEGGHRLTACDKAGVAIPVHIAFGSDPKVFDLIGQGKHRNAGDILQIHGVANSSKMSELARLIFLYDDGMDTNNTFRKLTHRDISSYVMEHHDEMQNSLSMQRLAQKERLPRANVYAAVHYCITAVFNEYLQGYLEGSGRDPKDFEAYENQRRDRIDEWFLNILHNTNLEKGTTSWYLRRKLNEGAINKHAYGPPRTEAIFTYLIRAWNSFETDRTLRKFHYTHGEGLPRIIRYSTTR